MNHLLHPLRGPITAADIARIESGMNVLFSHLFKDHQELLEEGLRLSLVQKIQGYIDLADHVNQVHATNLDRRLGDDLGADSIGANPNFAPELTAQMRALLELVKGYYHRLN